MKASKISKGLLLGLALLLATSVFAANKGSLQVNDPVTINGKQLQPGDYTVKWEGAGPNVELNILHGKQVIATVPARMVDINRAPDRDAAVTSINSDGQKSVSELRFSGKKYALAIGSETAKAESSDQPNSRATDEEEGSPSSPLILHQGSCFTPFCPFLANPE